MGAADAAAEGRGGDTAPASGCAEEGAVSGAREFEEDGRLGWALAPGSTVASGCADECWGAPAAAAAGLVGGSAAGSGRWPSASLSSVGGIVSFDRI